MVFRKAATIVEMERFEHIGRMAENDNHQTDKWECIGVFRGGGRKFTVSFLAIFHSIPTLKPIRTHLCTLLLQRARITAPRAFPMG